MPSRLFVDLKLDCNGNLVGTIKIPEDSRFMLEALLEVLEQFSKSCEIPLEEICNDLIALRKLR